MSTIERIKNIIVSPKTEWETIANESANINSLMFGYVLILAGLSAVAAFVGQGIVGVSIMGIKIAGINWGIYAALNVLIAAFAGTLITAFAIDILAPNFGSEKNLARSYQLVAYSFTPTWIGGLLAVIPALSVIGGLFGLYGLYLLYTGIAPIKNTPKDKQTIYFVVSLLVTLAVYIVIGIIVGKLLMGLLGLSYGSVAPEVNLDMLKHAVQ
jgi:hypothetical protein